MRNVTLRVFLVRGFSSFLSRAKNLKFLGRVLVSWCEVHAAFVVFSDIVYKDDVMCHAQ